MIRSSVYYYGTKKGYRQGRKDKVKWRNGWRRWAEYFNNHAPPLIVKAIIKNVTQFKASSDTHTKMLLLEVKSE
jgi:phosphatidate phosphatase APP1